MLLENRTIIVTGAARGLGAGIAAVCAREGARVIIADVLEPEARQTAGALTEDPAISGEAVSIPCDVADPAARSALVEACRVRFGRIDGLVNNAGLNFVKSFLEVTEEDWRRIIGVNLDGSFFLTQLAARAMADQQPVSGDRGSIVNIASVHSIAAIHGASPYDASKWGIVGFTKTAAIELARSGIRVNAVSPGLIATPMWDAVLDAAPSRDEATAYWDANIPMERTIRPEEIGELVAFLLSPRASSITGANLLADGGMTAQLISREPYESKPIEG